MVFILRMGVIKLDGLGGGVCFKVEIGVLFLC